jgi:hypothetical protein
MNHQNATIAARFATPLRALFLLIFPPRRIRVDRATILTGPCQRDDRADPGGHMARLRALIMHQRPALWLLLLMLLVPMTACSVRLIQPYDDAIETGVTDFYEEFLRFTTTVGRTRGTFADNRAFYDWWQPRLTTLTARAVAANPSGRCPSTETYGGLLPQGVTAARSAATPAGVRVDSAAAGDCTAQLLQLLEEQFADFAKFHDAQGALGLPPEARAPRELVLTSVRAVLYMELARKQGK